MSTFDVLTTEALKARGTQKWNRYPADVLPMWIAEMDYPTAPPVLEAVKRTVAADGFGYAEIDQRVPEAFAAFARRRLGMTVNPEWTTVVPHVLAGIEVALDALAPKAPVVVPTPTYAHFLVIPGLVGREAVEVPLLEDKDATDVNEHWKFDLDGIARAFADGARSIILCQPYNPVGKVFSREELAALAEIVASYDGFVISDEIHAPLTDPGVQHVAYAEASETAAGHCATVTSASKSFSMPGMPCATVILHTERTAKVFRDNAPDDHLYGATTLGVESHIAAFTEGDEWLDQVRAQVQANAQQAKRFVDAELPGVRYTPGQATYFAWLDFRETPIADDPAGWLLEHGKVAMNSGAAFGGAGKGWTRLNLATDPERLADGLQRIKKGLEAARA